MVNELEQLEQLDLQSTTDMFSQDILIHLQWTMF